LGHWRFKHTVAGRADHMARRADLHIDFS
jgi:hypothetical protein